MTARVINVNFEDNFADSVLDIIEKEVRNEDFLDTLLIFPSQRSAGHFRNNLILKQKSLVLPKITDLNMLNACQILSLGNVITDHDKTLKITQFLLEKGLGLVTALNIVDDVISAMDELELYGFNPNKLIEVKNSFFESFATQYELNINHLLTCWNQYREFLSANKLIDRTEKNIKINQKACEFLENTNQKVYLCGFTGFHLLSLKALKSAQKNPNITIILHGFNTPHAKQAPCQAYFMPQVVLEQLHCNFKLNKPKKKITLINSQNKQDEINSIKTLVKQEFNSNSKAKIGIITNSQFIANELVHFYKNQQVAISSMFSTRLDKTPVYGFFLELVLTLQANFKPIFLLSLCKNHLFFKTPNQAELMLDFEKYVLRKRNWCYYQNSHESLIKNIRLYNESENSVDLADFLEGICAKILDIKGLTFSDWIKQHKQCFDIFFNKNSLNNPDISMFYEELNIFLQEISRLNVSLDCKNIDDYIRLMRFFAAKRNFRPFDKISASIFVLNSLESQLINFDMTILADFNEGSFVKEANEDYLLPQNIRSKLGLQTSQEDRGISCFRLESALNSCPNEKLFITRTTKETQISSLINHIKLEDYEIRIMDSCDPNIFKARKIQNSKITLQNHQFPNKTSPTALKMLVHNPYMFYVRYILKFWPILAPEEDLNSLDVGKIFHSTLDEFYTTCITQKLEPSKERLHNIFTHYFYRYSYNTGLYRFWLLKLEQLSDKIIQEVNLLKISQTLIKTETKGLVRFRGIDIEATADRVDIDPSQKKFTIIDYKSSLSQYSLKKITTFMEPQIPLEMYIACKQGFGEFPSEYELEAKILPITNIKSSKENITINADTINLSIDDFMRQVEEFLENLLSVYMQKEATYCWQESNLPDENKLKHFLRI